MANIKEYSEKFKFAYEKFMFGCEALEEMGVWDEAQYGDMITYYDNDIVSIVTQLIASDGNISEKEVEKLEELFGFTYELEELQNLYSVCKENIEKLFAQGVNESYLVLKTKNVKLAGAYKDLINLVVQMAVECDGVVSDAEKEMALKLKDIIEAAE